MVKERHSTCNECYFYNYEKDMCSVDEGNLYCRYYERKDKKNVMFVTGYTQKAKIVAYAVVILAAIITFCD